MSTRDDSAQGGPSAAPDETQRSSFGSSPRAAALAALRRGLSRESHVLRERPDLLWQQLRARLRWEPDPWPGLIANEERKRALSPRSTWFAIAGPPVESGALVGTLSGHSAPVWACAMDAHATSAVSGDGAGQVRAWNLAGGVSTLLGAHSARVSACVLGLRGEYAATTSEDGTLRLWPLAGTAGSITVRVGAMGVNACAVSPDGSFVVTAGADGTVTVVRPGDGRVVAMHGHSGGVYACDVAPDGRFVVSASEDRTLRIWDPQTGATIRVLTGHGGPVWRCVVSPDGASVASISHDGGLRLWEVASGRCLAELERRR